MDRCQPPPSGFSSHDHAACVARATRTAAKLCADRGVRLTDLRRRVLEILLEDHRALGAYQILERLRSEGRAAQPPVAYRALDFLVGQGLVHKIERLNAYLACARPGADHDAAFLICRKCAAVAEAPLPRNPLDATAQAAGFELAGTTLEAEGLCPGCRE